jgi:hypothetical protein
MWRIAQAPQPSFSICDSIVQRTVENYRRMFGRNLLVFSFDMLRERPLDVLRSIESFLGLQSSFNAGNLLPGAINSRRRRNIKLISYIVSREELITAAGRVVPPRLLRALRTRMDLLSVPRGAPRADPSLGPDLELARKELSADCSYVSSLFASCQIQLGDGSAIG